LIISAEHSLWRSFPASAAARMSCPMLPRITDRWRTTFLEKRSICRLAGTDLRA
jgi:hypothetical protein